VQVGNVPSCNNVQSLSLDYIRNNIVVCVGSDTASSAIQNTLAFNGIHYLCICEGDLWVADMLNASIGLRFNLPGDTSPAFILLPREHSLHIMNNGKCICMAMKT
jgi:hypothetical protein